MNNIHLNILGSNPFINILNELEFNKIINPNIELNSNNKKISVKILFPENFFNSSNLFQVLFFMKYLKIV